MRSPDPLQLFGGGPGLQQGASSGKGSIDWNLKGGRDLKAEVTLSRTPSNPV
jgi:hypothetical protein